MAAARRLGDRRGEASALNDLGILRYLTGDYQIAAETLETALTIYRDLGDRLGQANSRHSLGSTLRRTADYAGAASSAVRITRRTRWLAWDTAPSPPVTSWRRRTACGRPRRSTSALAGPKPAPSPLSSTRCVMRLHRRQPIPRSYRRPDRITYLAIAIPLQGAVRPGRCLPSSIRLSLTSGKLDEDRTDLGTHRSSESNPIDHITSH